MKKFNTISIAFVVLVFVQTSLANQKYMNFAEIYGSGELANSKIYNALNNELPSQDLFPVAPKLDDPSGDVVRVKNVSELVQAVSIIKPGTTILIADGHYEMARSLVIRTDNVTIRSESDDRTKVILDFKNSSQNEGVVIYSKTGFVLASLTVQNVTQNGIKINSDHGVDKVKIYNVVSHNVWQRHIKGPLVPDNEDGSQSWVEDCQIMYCLFYNDRAKILDDDPYERDNPENFGGNYVGGIDIMSAKGWIISDNVFIGIRGLTGNARGAIFMWHNSYDCTIERNNFINNDSGICLGNSSARGERRHCTGFMVRNNFITRINANEGIFVGHSRNCQVLNNTIHNPGSGRLIRIAHANDGLSAIGNIFSGGFYGVNVDETDNVVPITFRNNLHKLSTQDFVDPDNGNLRVKETAFNIIDKGPVNENVTDDIDMKKRDNKPDYGAHEFANPATGLKNVVPKRLSCYVFPNPTNESITLKLEFQKSDNVYFRLYDPVGRLLEKQKVTGNETLIRMSTFKPGVYSIAIYEQDREEGTFKLNSSHSAVEIIKVMKY